MAERDVPQFQTDGPRGEGGDNNRVPRSPWWFIVKEIDLSDDANDPKTFCRCRIWTGTAEGQADYFVLYNVKPAVDDKLYAFRTNTGKLYRGKVVEWRQESGGSGLFPASGRFKLMQIIDDDNPGTWGADWLRFGQGSSGGGPF